MVGLLDRETELLVELGYDITVLGMLTASPDTDFLRRAHEQVEATAEQLRLTGLLRAVRSAAVAEAVGLPADSRLGELVEVLAEPDADTLRQARLRLVRALSSTQEVVDRASSTLGKRIGAIREALAAVGVDPVGIYGPGGERADPAGGAQLLRRVL